MARIFISYRRRDEGAIVAATLKSEVDRSFGSGSTMLDVDDPAVDVPEAIAKAISKCDAWVVVIGGDWRARLQRSNNVRAGIEMALGRNLPIVPVFVGNAPMPTQEELPDSLKSASFRNACEIRPGARLPQQVKSLMARLQEIVTKGPPPSLAPQPQEKKSADAAPAKAVERDYVVFISHASEDKRVAEALCEALESIGVRCWIAPRDIVAGSWAQAILNAIAACRLMALVFSSDAAKSPHVKRELELAVDRDMPILPMRVADVMPEGDVRYFLGGQHWIDLYPPPLEKRLLDVNRRVCDVLKIEPAATPSP